MDLVICPSCGLPVNLDEAHIVGANSSTYHPECYDAALDVPAPPAEPLP